MAFPESVVKEAWKNAGGRCECRRTTHGHSVPCNKELVWENRGRSGRGCWEAHHKVAESSGGSNTLSNCEILCFDCHSKTGSFGG